MTARTGQKAARLTRRPVSSELAVVIVRPDDDQTIQQPERPYRPSRCGEIWGSDCKVPVGLPDWCHGDHPDQVSRRMVANSPTSPPVLLLILSRDQDWYVRWGVAGNPNCPAEALDRLSQDVYESVRQFVACNWSCLPATLERLSRDRSWIVRQSVAGHPKCPLPVLRNLLRDSEELVGCVARMNPALSQTRIS